MRIVLILFFLFLVRFSFAQEPNFCLSKKVDKISNIIINRLSEKDKKELFNIPNYGDEAFIIIDGNYYFNYEDFQDIFNYTDSKRILRFDIFSAQQVISENVYNVINNNEKCLSNIIDVYINRISKKQEELVNMINKDSIKGIYIPKDIYDCLNQIDKFWDNKTKKRVSKMTDMQFSGETHFGFGTWMRNNWNLWNGSRLSNYFNNLGIIYAEDMSGIILDCYHKYLKKKPIEFNISIEYYKEYNKRNRNPKLKDYPNEVRNVEPERGTWFTFPIQNVEESLTFFADVNGKIEWLYTYTFGWKKMTKTLLNEYDKIGEEEIYDWLKKIYYKKD